MSHEIMLYYNITGVHGPKPVRLKSERTTRSVADAVNDNPRRVRSVEDHIGIGNSDDAAEITLVGDASPGVGMTSKQTNDGL